MREQERPAKPMTNGAGIVQGKPAMLVGNPRIGLMLFQEKMQSEIIPVRGRDAESCLAGQGLAGIQHGGIFGNGPGNFSDIIDIRPMKNIILRRFEIGLLNNGWIAHRSKPQ